MNNYVELIFRNNPGKTCCALVDRDGQRETSWRELYEGACRIAAHASRKGLSGLVPVCMPRCAENVISMLGLGLAGLGVAPLSDGTPEARIRLIEEQAENAVWTMEDFDEAMQGGFAPFEPVPFSCEAPAYVVYTSGSTGVPKGVMLSNTTVEKSYIRMASDEFLSLREGDAVLQNASFSFVALMIDLFAPLYKGIVTHILPDEARMDIKLMGEYINAHGITSMFITPKPLSRLGDCPSLRVVCVGGERVSMLSPKGYKLLNVWGMSETAALALGYNITEPMEKTPIGKSLGDFRTYIVDDSGALSDEGELCLSGAFASGYFKRPDLTEKYFEPNPFCNDEGHRVLMRTGDIVRRLPDGNILYLNRKDFMIKINGQRVEPGEAESVIERIEGVQSVAVKGFIEDDGRSYLCAYYAADDKVSEKLLRAELEKQLPAYMIPAFFVKMDALPLNSNGKLDRKALAKPALCGRQSAYEKGRSENEEKLCRTFEAVLGLERIGVNDDFIILGGDSIRAMSVVSLAGIKGLHGSDILAGRTPRGIAALVTEDSSDIFADLPRDIDRAELTDSQMGVYLECAAHPESIMYNIPVHLSFGRGTLTCEQVKTAVDKVFSQHGALLSHIETENEKVFMVRSAMSVGGICTVTEADESEAEKAFSHFAKPFELSKSPLCRINAILTDRKVHILMDIHHLVADGTSVNILTRQLCAAAAGDSVTPESVDAFALFEVERRNDVKLDKAREYFRKLLSGVETDSNLLFDHRAEADKTASVKRAEFRLDGLELSAVRSRGITESSFFMGVYGYALAKMTGQSASLFTAGESGRKSALLENTVAMMVRTLPVVMDIDEKSAPFELLDKLQTQFFETEENDVCSFGELVREYGIKSDVTFVYQSDMLDGFESAVGHADVDIPDTGDAFANLSTSVFKSEGGYVMKVDYRSGCYNAATVERFAAVFEAAAEAFSKNSPLGEITLISDSDRAFLDALNKSESPYDTDETIVDIFRRMAKAKPDNTLVVSGGTRISYREGDEISDRIAAYVRSLGIGRGMAVSVLIPRCEYMVLASMGVMKAGAMYQPLDPSYPPERLSFMCKDADAKLLIADRALAHILSDFTGKILYTDEIPTLPEAETVPEPPKPDDCCILLYTSGTTGTPKGCMLAHSNLTALVHTYVTITHMDSDCRIGAYASYGFDAHMADIYPPLSLGAEVHIIQDYIRLDMPAIKDYCEKFGLTHMIMTTQLARQFAVQYDCVKSMRCIMSGGEKLVAFEPKMNYTFLNAYGPTESTVMSSYFAVDRFYEDIPIGKTMPNMKLYVVDSFGRRLPVGVPGELVVAGAQVAQGYLNRPEKTAEVFVPNTFEAPVPKGYERCYRTGDIVRYVDDGNLMFIGRRDMQVKIRGFRVELGEVEHIIREFDGIRNATVVAGDAPSGGKCLFAYIVADEKIDIEALNNFILENKPPYMVPAATMQIASIPLTVNGKVDKRKLPKPELHFDDAAKPENETQQRIFDKVAEVVGTDGFGIDTDIFLAGLSSLSSIRLCSLLADEFGISVQIRKLKKYSTVRKLEDFVLGSLGNNRPAAETARAAEAVSYSPDHPISKTMEGIFAECVRKPDSTFYNIPYLVKLSPAIDEKRLIGALVSAVEAHPYMKSELFTDSEGRIRQHRRLDDAFTADRIGSIRAERLEDVRNSLVKPFKITDSALFEISLIHADALYLFLNFHHIIADGTSIALFIGDVEKAYAGGTPEAESYCGFDVADEECEARSGEDLRDAKEYYENLLEGLDRDFLPLPDRLPHYPESSGETVMQQSLADADKIRAYCEEHKISPNAFFVSAFGLVLSRYAGTDYSVFNTVYNGRNDSRKAGIFAMLVKTLPVVCHTDRENAAELCADTGAQLMDSMANDLYSYAEISRALGVKNDVMFIYQGDSFERSRFCGESAEEIPIRLSESKASIAMQVTVRNGELVYDLEYDPKKFTEKLAHAIVSAFDKVCADFVEKEKLCLVSMLSEADEAEMEKYNDTEFEYDRAKTITGMFLENVRRQPEQLCTAYKNTRLSYGEVGGLTGRTAKLLMREGIGRGDVVAILINRDENMVIAAHGALRTGAAYLGLDPTYPSDRLEFMISDSGAEYLIAERSLMDRIPAYTGKVLYTDEIAALPPLTDEEAADFAEDEKHRITPENDALIIYSSGTTGLPKGSVLQHKAIVCFYHNYTRDAMMDKSSNVATYASFGFDGGAQDVLCVPMCGAALFVIPDEIRLDMSSLEQFYVRNAISSGFMTTQVGVMFIGATKCRSLKSFTVGGEKFIPVTAPEWVAFGNGYGPSETFCYVNRFRVKDIGSLQPIGKVNGNTKEYIIDRFGNRQPFGACGELCISGGQMGRGYLNRPEKTAQVFVSNPFCDKDGYRRMYRTGDVVRMLPDGNYDFVGRRDGQVKIRGFRIELSEVEGQIRKFEGIKKAVVTAPDNPSGGKLLAAYVVADGELDIGKLKSFISAEKPDYMVPAVIMQIDSVPLTSNGKVDMRKLPKIELGSLKKGAEPADEAEESICRIFGDVIGLDRVYADDDFFAIGGSSISAIQVIVRCEQAGLPIVYKNLFANPTAQKLAAFLRGENREDILAADFEKGDGHDYSCLKYNVFENLPKICNNGLGDVLLTGATGFLGSHVFRELLNSTDGRVICIVRSKPDMSAEMRLEMMTVYYFEDWYCEELRRRVTVIDGDMENAETLEQLKALHFDTIINCAANVKHFAAGNELLSSNFTGVENLIRLAEYADARLIQISSLSVCGESVNGSVPRDYRFRETDLNIGQSLENKYIHSKYLAEQALIDAISRGRIRGKVIRLGNLMARADDSQFQVNAGTNGFLRLFVGFCALGCFPISMMDSELEFSPIDSVAKAVVMLSGTPDEFTVFHAKNCNAIHYGYFLLAMQEAGKHIETVEDSVFEERLNKALKDESKVEILGGLLSYRNDTQSGMAGIAEHTGDADADSKKISRTKVGFDSSFTTKALYRLGFAWPLISSEYLEKMVETLMEMNFFSDGE